MNSILCVSSKYIGNNSVMVVLLSAINYFPFNVLSFCVSYQYNHGTVTMFCVKTISDGERLVKRQADFIGSWLTSFKSGG